MPTPPVSFEDGPDRGRILVSGAETGGAWSLMEYVVAAGPAEAGADGTVLDYGPHRHGAIEETFYVQSGSLQFLLGQDVLALTAGDVVRVPPGVRHGYANVSGAPVDLLVSFHPGGFETLFVRHRSDQDPPPRPGGFVEDAVAEFDSMFEGSGASAPI